MRPVPQRGELVGDERVVDDVQAHARTYRRDPRGRDSPDPLAPADLGGATMGAVAYFTAVIARTPLAPGARGTSRSTTRRTLEELTDALRGVSVGDQPVLAVIEHEDEWFALVRVDGDDDPRLFVSDLDAAAHATTVPCSPPRRTSTVPTRSRTTTARTATRTATTRTSEDEEPKVAAWAGETDLLEDLGISGRDRSASSSRRTATTRARCSPRSARSWASWSCSTPCGDGRTAGATGRPTTCARHARGAATLARQALAHRRRPGRGRRARPAGTVLVAAACNAREADGDPTAHAEVLALRAAAAALGTWRLTAARWWSRSSRARCAPARSCWPGWPGWSSAPRTRRRARSGSLWDVVRDRRLNHRPEVVGGVLEPRSAARCCAPSSTGHRRREAIRSRARLRYSLRRWRVRAA